MYVCELIVTLRHCSRRNPCRCGGGSLRAPSASRGQTSSSAAHSGNWHNLWGREKAAVSCGLVPATGLEAMKTNACVSVLTISVPKGGISMTGHSLPLAHATRMDIINSILLRIEGPVGSGFEKVDFLNAVLLPLQSRLDICYRKTQLTHRIWSCDLPLSIKHPVAVACHGEKKTSFTIHSWAAVAVLFTHVLNVLQQYISNNNVRIKTSQVSFTSDHTQPHCWMWLHVCSAAPVVPPINTQYLTVRWSS